MKDGADDICKHPLLHRPCGLSLGGTDIADIAHGLLGKRPVLVGGDPPALGHPLVRSSLGSRSQCSQHFVTVLPLHACGSSVGSALSIFLHRQIVVVFTCALGTGQSHVCNNLLWKANQFGS